ncbi:MAG: hypothetical protein WCI11_15070 [Candidatus Methylumidiphilus sp.]
MALNITNSHLPSPALELLRVAPALQSSTLVGKFLAIIMTNLCGIVKHLTGLYLYGGLQPP